jgi:hypothetical protein
MVSGDGGLRGTICEKNLLIAGNLISGSRIPPFFLVALALTQSLKGPAVASPIIAPTKIAKFMNPILWLLKL